MYYKTHCVLPAVQKNMPDAFQFMLRHSPNDIAARRGLFAAFSIFNRDMVDLALSDFRPLVFDAGVDDKVLVPILGLFNGFGKESSRCKTFNRIVASSPSELAVLKQLRRQIVVKICWRGHKRLLKRAIKKLTVTGADVNDVGEVSATPLWIASHTGNVSILQQILRLEGGLRDDRGPDGTTAFAIALGHRNSEIARLLLTSNAIRFRESMDFLARTVLLEDNDGHEDTRRLKETIRQTLQLPDVERIFVGGFTWTRGNVLHSLVDLSRRYPLVNDDCEYKWNANHRVIREMVEFGRRPNLQLLYLNNFILGKFCFESPRGSWAVGTDVVLKECEHNGERYVCISVLGPFATSTVKMNCLTEN